MSVRLFSPLSFNCDSHLWEISLSTHFHFRVLTTLLRRVCTGAAAAHHWTTTHTSTWMTKQLCFPHFFPFLMDLLLFVCERKRKKKHGWISERTPFFTVDGIQGRPVWSCYAPLDSYNQYRVQSWREKEGPTDPFPLIRKRRRTDWQCPVLPL